MKRAVEMSLLACLAYAALGAPRQAEATRAAPVTMEDFGAEVLFSSAVTSVGTVTVTGMLSSWSVSAIGAAITFQMQYSTMAASATGYQVLQSSPVIVVSSQSVNGAARTDDQFNPQFYIQSLPSGATAYVDIDYFKPRGGGIP